MSGFRRGDDSWTAEEEMTAGLCGGLGEEMTAGLCGGSVEKMEAGLCGGLGEKMVVAGSSTAR